MAGNSQRKGAMRNPGSKKGPTVGTGGARRKGLQPKGPTPKATERPHHPAARRERAAARRADEAVGKKINTRTGVAPTGRASGPRKRPTADGGGFFGVIDLPPGEYTLIIERGADRQITLPTLVTAGKVATVNFP
jgi:23S rRNA (guanosine2251-2'-O)-methyltransferase